MDFLWTSSVSMAMSSSSRYVEFNMGNESFVEYAERFNFFLSASGITDNDRKHALFIANIGVNAYKVLRNLVEKQLEQQRVQI